MIYSPDQNTLKLKEKKQDGRLPPAYFPPSNFAQKAFKKDENVSFPENTFHIFSEFNDSLAEKTTKLRRKRHFQETISFDTHSTANFPSLPVLEKIKFFSKKGNGFFPRTQISYVLRNLTISVAFYGQFYSIWWLKNFPSQNRYFRTLTFGGHHHLACKGLKNRRIWAFEWMIFFPYFEYGQKTLGKKHKRKALFALR